MEGQQDSKTHVCPLEASPFLLPLQLAVNVIGFQETTKAHTCPRPWDERRFQLIVQLASTNKTASMMAWAAKQRSWTMSRDLINAGIVRAGCWGRGRLWAVRWRTGNRTAVQQELECVRGGTRDNRSAVAPGWLAGQDVGSPGRASGVQSGGQHGLVS